MRAYVDGMPNSGQLLDLLSATGSDELEPTAAAAAGRGALYPEVTPLCLPEENSTHTFCVSISLLLP